MIAVHRLSGARPRMRSWRAVTCGVLCAVLASVAMPAPSAFSQGPNDAGASGDADAKTAAFMRLYAMWSYTQDPEQKIQLGQQLLALEPGLRSLATYDPSVAGRLWFEQAIAYRNRVLGDPSDNLDRAIAAYESALTGYRREAYPLEWARIQYNLGNAYGERIRGDRADNMERSLGAFKGALTVFTRDAQPREWAAVQNNIGLIYESRVRGDRADNLEQALAAYAATLTIITREASPPQWASTQNNIGNAYQNRIRGSRPENLENAIAALSAALTVFNAQAFPGEWADAYNNLGTAYLDRVHGQLADNIETAIAAFNTALTVRTRERAPYLWSRSQLNLGLAYERRVRGERADNIEQAIAAFEAALSVLPRDAAPYDWAVAHNGLGLAYADRIRGDRSDNLDKAISAFEASLSVQTREALPQGWAGIQNNLGLAYWRRTRGNIADNQERAIAAFEAALMVLSRDSSPREWSLAQSNLGLAYAGRMRGGRAENVERAIAAYEAALTVRSREAFPREWADTQHNLGLAYERRTRGEREQNRAKAIAAYGAALTVTTRDVLPREHLTTSRLLGAAFLESERWQEASEAYASARDAFSVLFGQGLNEAEARELVAEAGPLFAEAAYVATRRGEATLAFELATEGRARLMAVALRLRSLDLAADKTRRLDELRGEIRATDRMAESAQGAKRAEAVGRLGRLRQELLSLVKDASAADARSQGSPLAQALRIAGNGGAVVVPIITRVGGKLLIVTGKSSSALTVLDMPELTTDRVGSVMRGDGKAGKTGGWLEAYGINYLGEAEQERRWGEWLAAIDNLGPTLWGLVGHRLDGGLKKAGIRSGARVVWLPSGALGILPLGLAQDPASKRRLGDEYEIAYAPSLQALASAQDHLGKTVSATLAAIIDPTGDLPGTEKEGNLVASYFPARARSLLARQEATTTAVLEALKGKTYWHFASHGSFSWSDARRSALLMHGKTPLSVGQLLDTDRLGRPRLVVMSACETGLYDINSNADEFIGLPGAFTALGAAGVLGTLWPVSDAATALLMAKFYELHMAGGLPPPTALRQAQAWLRQATTVDLVEYPRLAARQGKLSEQHAMDLERRLDEAALARSRNAVAIEWTTADDARSPGAKPSTAQQKRLARPYAHPYFWAGFIYTGL